MKRLARLFLFAILLTLPIRGVYAITIVQSKTSVTSGSATSAVSFTSLPATGDAVIVVTQYLSATSVTGVADNQTGNTYSSVVENTFTAGGTDTSIWWLPSVVGSSGTFTVTATATGGSSNFAVTIIEVSGLSGTVDQTGTATSGTTSLTDTASAANTNANDLVIAAIVNGYTTTPSGMSDPATTGYTSVSFYDGSSSAFAGVAEVSSKTVSAIETSSATWSTTAAMNGGAAVLATFKGTATSSCTHSFWSSAGTFTQPNGSSGSYWNCATRTFSTPNCSTGSFWRSDRVCAAN